LLQHSLSIGGQLGTRLHDGKLGSGAGHVQTVVQSQLRLRYLERLSSNLKQGVLKHQVEILAVDIEQGIVDAGVERVFPTFLPIVLGYRTKYGTTTLKDRVSHSSLPDVGIGGSALIENVRAGYIVCCREIGNGQRRGQSAEQLPLLVLEAFARDSNGQA